MQKRDSVSVPRDTQKCEQEDWAAVSGSKRIAPYRLDQSRVEAYTTGFSQTFPRFLYPVPWAAARTAPNGIKEKGSFCLVFRSLNTTSSHRMFFMGYRRAKSTQGNTNFQKRFFWQTTSGSLPAGLKKHLHKLTLIDFFSQTWTKRQLSLGYPTSRLCTPTHTGHRDWFGCPGVTAATELLNIR